MGPRAKAIFLPNSEFYQRLDLPLKTFILCFVLFSGCQIFAQEPDLVNAVKLLTENKPMPPAARTKVMQTDPVKKTEWIKLYSEELAAIEVVRKSRKEVNLNVLLPYLNFTTVTWFGLSSDAGALRTQPFPTEDMDRRRATWPIFSLILDMPNAADSLEKYSMDIVTPSITG